MSHETSATPSPTPPALRKNWLKTTASILPNVLVLGGLGAMFLLGPKVGWNPMNVPALLGMTAHAGTANDESPAAEVNVEGSTAATVRGQSTDEIVLTEETAKDISLATTAAERKDLTREIVVPGEVNYDPYLTAELTSRLPGVVWRVDKKVGEEVVKGDVLALIDSAEVGEAKARLLQAVVQIDLRGKIRKTMNDDVTPLRMVREAEASLREARVTAHNAEQSLRSLRLPIRNDEVADLVGMDEDELARRVQFLGLPDEVVAGLDPQTATSNLIPLIAPFDGVVIGRSLVIGEVVGTDEKHFTVADVRQMWVTLEVRQEDAGLLDEGLDVEFTPDGDFKRVVKAKLSWVSTEADDRTRTVQARAIVDNSDRRLHANTFGTGRIRVAKRDSALVVPNSSLQQDVGTNVVFVQGDDVSGGQQYLRREVQTGLRTETHTEILSGLEEGETVVTAGSFILRAEVTRRRQNVASL